jgi:predicted metal-binding protein
VDDVTPAGERETSQALFYIFLVMTELIELPEGHDDAKDRACYFTFGAKVRPFLGKKLRSAGLSEQYEGSLDILRPGKLYRVSAAGKITGMLFLRKYLQAGLDFCNLSGQNARHGESKVNGRFLEKEILMAKIAVLYCKKIQDHSCMACAKCHKGMAEKNGEYSRHDSIELVAMTDCGDCPGLVVPRVKMLTELTKGLGREIEVLHLGTCIKLAIETAQCPIKFDTLQVTLEKKFGLKVVLGTHSY